MLVYITPMIRRMRCAEHRRLLGLYADATGRLSELTATLADAAATYERDAFDRTWEKCEEARQLCVDIRRQLYEHVEEHRCTEQLGRRGSMKP